MTAGTRCAGAPLGGLARIVALATLATISASCATASHVVPRGPRSAAIPLDALTETNACKKLCDRLGECGGAPPGCEVDCERDRARTRPGVAPSFASCVTRELVAPLCAGNGAKSDLLARRERVALCYSATLDAYAQRDAGASLQRVIASLCRRRAKCAPPGALEAGACRSELEAHGRGAGLHRMLSVVREEAVIAVAACVEERSCDDADPVTTCTALVTPA